MSETNGSEAPKIHIDDDWKQQAQAEKERLAAEAGQGSAAGPGGAEGSREGRGPLPEASFSALISRIAMEVSLYLGDIQLEGAENRADPEMAKFNIDLLQVIEEKTRGNLSDEEKRLMDSVLYELRMRYVQRISG